MTRILDFVKEKTIRIDRAYYMAVHHWNKIIETIEEYIRLKPNMDLYDFITDKDITWGRTGCTYCEIFADYGCDNCPISTYTLSGACSGTPWVNVHKNIINDVPTSARTYAIRLRDLILRAKPKNMMEWITY